MMRGPEAMVMAVRRPDGTVVVKDGNWVPLVKRIPVLRWPFLRGAVVMIEAMVNGMQALSFSADQALVTEGDEEGLQTDKGPGKALSTASIALTITLAMGLGVVLFVYVPHFCAGAVLNLLIGQEILADPDLSNPGFHLLTGFFKVSIFVGYVVMITAMKDIRRVFQYHGAEHKSIYTWEAGEELTVANAQKYSRLHPRCGTAFLAFVIIVAIALFAGVFPLLPFVQDLEGWRQFAVGASIKIPMLFPIAGFSYEFIKFAGKFKDNPLLKVMSLPGMLMQYLTTREPDDKQVEVALVSLIRALEIEGEIENPVYPSDDVLQLEPDEA
jgi:uncharacterized protein YqhQ